MMSLSDVLQNVVLFSFPLVPSIFPPYNCANARIYTNIYATRNTNSLDTVFLCVFERILNNRFNATRSSRQLILIFLAPSSQVFSFNPSTCDFPGTFRIFSLKSPLLFTGKKSTGTKISLDLDEHRVWSITFAQVYAVKVKFFWYRKSPFLRLTERPGVREKQDVEALSS